MLSYDPDKRAEVPPDLAEHARTLGLVPVYVICDSLDHSDCVSFWAMTQYPPARNDVLILQDGKRCQVERRAFKAATWPDGTIQLVPTICSVLVPEDAANG